MQIVPFDSPLAASEAAQTELEKALVEAQKEHRPVLLLLSGGSNLDVVADVDRSLLSAATIYPLDERFSANPALNNSLQLEKLGLPVERLIPEPTEDVESFGQRFNQLLTDWQKKNPQGVKLATIGMGPDGHIAGISPLPDQPERFDQLFVTTTNAAVGYEGNLEPPARITVTLPFLQSLDMLVGYVTGESKAEALRAAFSPQATTDFPQDLAVLPAAMLPSLEGSMCTTIQRR